MALTMLRAKLDRTNQPTISRGWRFVAAQMNRTIPHSVAAATPAINQPTRRITQSAEPGPAEKSAGPSRQQFR
jgi:hypothetical protein